jgi:hypothetical protein
MKRTLILAATLLLAAPAVAKPTKLPYEYYRLGATTDRVTNTTPGTGSFDLLTWRGAGGTAYTVSAEAGVLSSSQAGGGIY